ncbi:head maturation protease, ClpP-related [Rhodopirellula sp. MGV]|uniref:head maturation protease, ClpP-related n=1 Tax=Rhodopirellula sp. MGV TaxID=2023130 RepID=UPI000B9632D8|nr:head maturation protease, ClpP-related [Rhodopirellula sp. MGV]OYP38896.1 hypothetical protein CGZ80_01365 [Rhodopirellula sp. MGV]PNY38290.1 Clp protease ClpP [Rhodopirellula baltica]
MGSHYRPFNLRSVPQTVRDGKQPNGHQQRYQIRNNADDLSIQVYDTIGEDPYTGEGVSEKTIVDMLDRNRHKNVSVRINSFGGDVYAGLLIFNALAAHPRAVTTTIEGIAFSAASYIALAGDRMRMFQNSDFGIHRASTITWGNRHDHLSTLQWLDTIDEHLIDIYERKTGKSRAQITKWLEGTSDGTVFSATEAKRHGFCDEIIDPKGPSNRGARTAASSSSNRSSSGSTDTARKLRLLKLKAAIRRL